MGTGGSRGIGTPGRRANLRGVKEDRLELAVGVELGLIEVMGRGWVGTLPEDEHRARPDPGAKFDDGHPGVAGDAVAPLLAGFGPGVPQNPKTPLIA